MDTQVEDYARQEDIEAVLNMRRVAMVGLSSDPAKPSFAVGHYLKRRGYEVVPVNPTETEVLGEKAYASLSELPEPPEVVDVFRRPNALPQVVDEAIAAGARAVWFQLGVVNEEAARKAREAGLIVVMDRCMKIENSKRFGN
ncbi:MAG: CoA-binding protein [Chloroflexota bacterium]|nr:CoA-binding protein [Chloroflexota bacterium]